MKNCPWFSLRSNSIESRYRSIRRGNFQVNVSVNLRKSRSKIKSNSEFASLIKPFYSLRSVQAQFFTCDLRLFRLHSLKSCFSESLGANFADVARRHSLCSSWFLHRKVKASVFFNSRCWFIFRSEIEFLILKGWIN